MFEPKNTRVCDKQKQAAIEFHWATTKKMPNEIPSIKANKKKRYEWIFNGPRVIYENIIRDNFAHQTPNTDITEQTMQKCQPGRFSAIDSSVHQPDSLCQLLWIVKRIHAQQTVLSPGQWTKTKDKINAISFFPFIGWPFFGLPNRTKKIIDCPFCKIKEHLLHFLENVNALKVIHLRNVAGRRFIRCRPINLVSNVLFNMRINVTAIVWHWLIPFLFPLDEYD